MAVSVDQFGKSLVASGLMTAEDVKASWNAIAAGEHPKDGGGFAQALIDSNKLTPFQAAELLAGRGARLMMGDYTIVSQIGAGGMGQVYKAQHRRMKRTVALKVMSNAAMQDEAAVKRFQREVHAAAKLEHPNIVTAYDSGESGSVKYLVMQFVDGGDLSDLVKKNGRLGIEQAVGYVIQAARGLAFAHGEGVIHRDIKPANLLLDKKGIVKILDMGLARFEDGGDGLTATEQVMGTVDYMSPEQAANTKGCDGRADIYSLGCTLWYLLTGKKLYEADTLIARLMLHRDGPLPSLVKERDDAPWPLEQALHKMIAKQMQDRYQTMDEVVAALAPFGSGDGSSSGMGSGIGLGTSTANAEMASFLKSVGPVTGPSMMTAPSKTNVAVDATAQFTAATADTDPKSQLLPPSKKAAQPQAKGSGKKPPPNKNLILAGAGGAALLVLLGVWFIFRDKDGNEIARVQMPEGGSVVVQQPAPVGTKPAATPSSSVSFFLPGTTPAGTPTFISPTFISPSASPGVQYLPAGKWGLDFHGDDCQVIAKSLPERKTPVVTYEMWLSDATVGSRDYNLAVGPNGKLFRFQARYSFYTYHNNTNSPAQEAIPRRFHLAGVNDSRRRLLFIDGKLVGTHEDGGGVKPEVRDAVDPLADLILGDNRFRGVIDAVRVSSVARYDKDFTPPQTFTPDKETVALYLFNEGSGNVLKDSSGNNYHGQITDATWVRGGATSPTPTVPTSAVPATNGVVYLDDLKETKFSSFMSKLGKHGGDSSGKPLQWHGRQPTHSLFMHAHGGGQAASIEYSLAGKFETLSATVGLNNNEFASSPLTFRVLGDGRELWKSPPIKSGTTEAACSVSVAGLQELRIEVVCDGSNFKANAVWVDPRLTPVAAVSASPAPGANTAGTTPPPAVFPFDAPTARKHQEAWAKHLGVPIEFTNTVGMKFRLIPPGEFQMGLGPEFTDEELLRLNSGKDDLKLRGLHMARPAHPVRITRPFYMEVEEVTSGRYRDVVGQLRAAMTPEPDRPLTSHVAWPDAIAFCNKLSERERKRPAYRLEGAQITPDDDADGYRLPTEAQWEYACRAGTNTLWYFGSDVGVDHLEFKKRCAAANPFGLTGLYGGANEWCWDATDGKPYSAAMPNRREDPREDVGTSRIKRGGSGNDDGGGNRAAINSFVRIRTSGGPYGPDTSRYTGFGRVVLPITAITPPLSDTSNDSGRSPGAATTVAAPQSPLATTKTDLLKGLDVVANAVAGKFALDGQGLRVTDGAQQARVVLPVAPMPAEYDLHVAVGRVAPGGKAFVIGVPWQGSQGCVVIDGFSNPPLSGLELIDGQTPKVNGTENPGEKITFGPRNHKVVVRVRNEGIAAEYDGKPLFDWKGKPSRLSTHAMWTVPRKDLPFLGFQGPYVVHGVELLPFVSQPSAPAASPGKLFMHDPAFPQWMKDVQAMPAERQIEAVSKKLMELNPGFDGRLMGQKEIGTPKIENGMVTELNFSTENVTDISPVRALVGLKYLWCGVSSGKKARLSDLSPLGGMGLTFLNCNDSQVTDLSPLKGMPLSTLYCTGTAVTDLSPLQGMQKLTLLACHGTPVSDLSPLQGLPLKKLHVAQTRVTDVSPLAACKTLTELYVRGTKVTPASVAALQQVLPGCKIEWDDPAKATPNVGTK